MEERVSSFCKTLVSFCNHLQSSCDALKQSVDRRPIPLDSASSTFIQCLNRRVSSASSDLNLLESMSFGTVSFEELLGHCNEVYKKNQTHLAGLEDRLNSLGYLPEIDDDEDGEISTLSTPLVFESKLQNSTDELDSFRGATCAVGSIMKGLEDDPLSDESLSLLNLGLSDVCLATLASEGNGKIDDPNISFQRPVKHNEDKRNSIGVANDAGELGKSFMKVGNPKSVINVSKEEYESLPSYMKSLASWEDLLAAVDKINLRLSEKESTTEANFFPQDEVTSLGLGPKGRSYLLLLLRMNRFVVETTDGSISYRVL